MNHSKRETRRFLLERKPKGLADENRLQTKNLGESEPNTRNLDGGVSLGDAVSLWGVTDDFTVESENCLESGSLSPAGIRWHLLRMS